MADLSWDDDTEVALWHIFIATNCKHNPKEPEVMRKRDLVILMRTCKGEATIPIHAPLGRTSSCTLLLFTPSPPNIVALFVSMLILKQPTSLLLPAASLLSLCFSTLSVVTASKVHPPPRC